MILGMKLGLSQHKPGAASQSEQVTPALQTPLGPINLVEGIDLANISLRSNFAGSSLVFSLAAGSAPLPAGVTLSSQGQLEGVPSELLESTTILVQASNGLGMAQADCAISVDAREVALTLNGVEDDPVFGPTARINQNLTAEFATANWSPSVTMFQWHTVEDGPIDGADNAVFQPSAAEIDGKSVFCRVTAAPHAPVDSTILVVRRDAPTQSMTLPDEIFDVDTGDQMIEAAGAFAGDNLQFSVVGAGAQIDAATGQVLIPTDVIYNAEQVTVTAANTGGSTDQSFVVTVESADLVLDQTAIFGADTLGGAGSYQVVDASGYPATNVSDLGTGSATGYVLSADGKITTTATGSLASQDGNSIDIDSDQGSARISLNVIADAYSVEPDEAGPGELREVIDLGAAVTSGKTIIGRPGRQIWWNSTLKNRGFTDLVTITSADTDDRFTFFYNTNAELRQPINLRFLSVDFDWSFEVGLSSSKAGLITLKNDIDNLHFVDCEFSGGLSDTIALNGQPFTGGEWGYRGALAKDGTAYLIGDMSIRDCLIHDVYRGFNLPGGPGVLTVEGNEIYNCSVDTGVLAGQFPNGRIVRWNILRDPIVIDPPEIAVLAIDLATNQMTVDSDRFGKVGANAVINMARGTSVMPGGVNLPGVNGSNDYPCSILSVANGQSVLQFPIDITSEGSNVFVRTEPPHADFLQGIPGAGSPAVGLEIIGNIILGSSSLDGYWPQGFFLEDVSSSTVPGYYEETVFAGNLVWSGNPHGLGLYNSKRGLVAHNTMVGPATTTPQNLPRVRLLTQFGHTGEHNVMVENVSAHNYSAVASDIVAMNHDIDPSQYSTSAYFDAPTGTTPTDVLDLVASYARQDMTGSIDYLARTYDLAAVNMVDPYIVDAVTDADLFVETVSAPVQITGIVNGQGTASTVGAMVAVVGGISAKFRITNDAAGIDILQDWTNQPTTIQEGQYLWLKTNAESDGLTALDVIVFVGRRQTTWTVTTKAATPTIQLFDQKTNAVSISTNLVNRPQFTFAAALKLTPANSLNRLFANSTGTLLSYDPTSQEITLSIAASNGAKIYEASYRTDLSKRRHLYISYNAPSATPRVLLDGIELTPEAVTTPAATGTGLIGLSGLVLFDRPGGNRPAGAEALTQLVVSTQAFDPADVYTLGILEDISALDAQAEIVIDGSRMDVQQFNAGANYGTLGTLVVTNLALDAGMTSGI